MKCTILGCGSSKGAPEIGCSCYTCRSSNVKNNRTRSSIMIEDRGVRIIVDTGPDFRQQALRHGIDYADAIIYTHFHADHVAGIDDIKPLYRGNTIPCYTNLETKELLEGSYGYVFEQRNELYPALLTSKVVGNNDVFNVNGVEVKTFEQDHASMKSLGLRFGNIAYSTDLCFLSEEKLESLKGIGVWIIDCLRYSWAPTHSYLEQTLYWIEKVKPKRAILTHMSHDIEYEEVSRILPSNVEPAYDGMLIA